MVVSSPAQHPLLQQLAGQQHSKRRRPSNCSGAGTPTLASSKAEHAVKPAKAQGKSKDQEIHYVLDKRTTTVCEEDLRKYLQIFLNSPHDECRVFVYFCTIGLLYYKFRREAPVEFTRFGGGNTGVGISSARFNDTILRRNAVSTAQAITTWAERATDGTNNVLFFARVFYDADEVHKATRDVHVKRIQDGMLHKSNLAGQRNKGLIDFDPELLKRSVYCCKSKCDRGFFLTFSLLLPPSFEAVFSQAGQQPQGVMSRLRSLASYLKTTRSLGRSKNRVIYNCTEYAPYGHTCVSGGTGSGRDSPTPEPAAGPTPLVGSVPLRRRLSSGASAFRDLRLNSDSPSIHAASLRVAGGNRAAATHSDNDDDEGARLSFLGLGSPFRGPVPVPIAGKASSAGAAAATAAAVAARRQQSLSPPTQTILDAFDQYTESNGVVCAEAITNSLMDGGSDGLLMSWQDEQDNIIESAYGGSSVLPAWDSGAVAVKRESTDGSDGENRSENNRSEAGSFQDYALDIGMPCGEEELVEPAGDAEMFMLESLMVTPTDNGPLLHSGLL